MIIAIGLPVILAVMEYDLKDYLEISVLNVMIILGSLTIWNWVNSKTTPNRHG